MVSFILNYTGLLSYKAYSISFSMFYRGSIARSFWTSQSYTSHYPVANWYF
ncbi:NADH-ubiquinone oxidoreductase chain 4L [Gossypium arboreum]|uniref:NADH-ubiquinone oxidoreductase chain 4L n=1 Tax=Gossypium arboreum TaxID=29729 RepID=A0A0B0NZS4_GOSAR|nr:NADH-ubiquinone oxidoreductase chain 4L [Gossypium arboreum]